jgi:acyl dehydratase
MRTITGLEELKAAEGETLGTSDWHEITQKDVDTFADVTGDHQWIHVDVERAKETPFGGTIAHGYLTLSLGPALNNQVFKLEGFTFALNYGLNKVRFPATVPIPSKVRVAPTVKEVTDIPGGAQVVFEITFEREGTEKPVCVAETVVRVYAGEAAGS